MKEILFNDYIKIKPLEHKQFIINDKTSYEEMGTVLLSSHIEIPVGSICYFDSYTAKKYPIPGKEGVYEWFVPYSEIVKIETDVE